MEDEWRENRGRVDDGDGRYAVLKGPSLHMAGATPSKMKTNMLSIIWEVSRRLEEVAVRMWYSCGRCGRPYARAGPRSPPARVPTYFRVSHQVVGALHASSAASPQFGQFGLCKCSGPCLQLASGAASQPVTLSLSVSRRSQSIIEVWLFHGHLATRKRQNKKDKPSRVIRNRAGSLLLRAPKTSFVAILKARVWHSVGKPRGPRVQEIGKAFYNHQLVLLFFYAYLLLVFTSLSTPSPP